METPRRRRRRQIRSHPCERCGGPAKRWDALICGACYAAIRRDRHVATADQRFDAMVDRRGPDECWPWLGARHPKGHGAFDRASAPRFALSRAIGRQLVAGEYALHRCDNPPCVNPAHLWAGSIAENNADAAKKGRMNKRLTFDDVTALRRDKQAGVPTKVLAARYGVNRTTVQRTARGDIRQHVPMPV